MAALNKTRIELAREGIITDEVKAVALDERVSAEQLSQDLAEGLTVISRNSSHDIKPLGIGKGLRTKINANIGTSRDRISLDEEMEKLRDTFVRETDPGKQTKIAEQIQVRAMEIGTHAHIGQYYIASAWRTDRLEGVLSGPVPYFWNISKSE